MQLHKSTAQMRLEARLSRTEDRAAGRSEIPLILRKYGDIDLLIQRKNHVLECSGHFGHTCGIIYHLTEGLGLMNYFALLDSATTLGHQGGIIYKRGSFLETSRRLLPAKL